jgi:hypothetical protein
MFSNINNFHNLLKLQENTAIFTKPYDPEDSVDRALGERTCIWYFVVN